jgi:hypothetical protein
LLMPAALTFLDYHYIYLHLSKILSIGQLVQWKQ